MHLHRPHTIAVRPRPAAAVLAALALFALPAQAIAAAPPGNASDFRLPPSTTQDQPPPERQGPVAPDVPQSQTPAPTTSPTPTTTPAPTPRPAITLPASRPAAVRPAARPAAAPLPAPIATPTPAAGAPVAPPTAAAPSAAPMPQPAAHRPAPPASESGAAPWWWLLAGLGLLLVLGVAAVMLRRGRGGDLSRRAAVPVVERPQPVAPVMPAAPAMPAAPGVPMPPSSPAAPPPPLQITLVPRRMDLTLVNAALTWRVDLTNLGPTPLAGLAVAADMISAHAGLTEQERSAGPDADSASVAVGTLEPGQSGTASGEIRLPFPRIQPIWHGEIALFMPLLRLRVAGDGIGPITRVFLVGQPSTVSDSTLQPFRLDLGPRVYPDLAQRLFA